MCSSKRRLTLCVLIAAALLAGPTTLRGAAKPAVAQADNFHPSFAGSVSNPAADTPADVTLDCHIPDGDVYHSFAGDFTPTEWQWTPSSKVDLGVQRAVMDVVTTMGFGNTPCNTSMALHYDMLNATTDKSRTVTFQDGLDDSNGDGNPDFIDMYPDFNDRILGPAQPIVRDVAIDAYGGLVVQFLLYEPGATLFGRTFDPALGQPYVVLPNMGDPEAVPNPNATMDFCSPLDFTIVFFGSARDGTVLVKNPKEAGTYTFNTLWVGLRDADGDGHENTLDPCPLDPDPTWNPRVAQTVGDADGDGLPSSCDPDDNKFVRDPDGDGYANRQDNCPLVANGEGQAGTAAGNQKDSDSDGIGDACDPNPDQADAEGEAPEVLLSQDVTITEPGPPVASIALPAPGSAVQLYPGCNIISLTFPDGTPSQTVVQAVTPAGATDRLWRFNPSQNRFQGFSAAFPQASDLISINFLDAVWLCMAEAPPGGVASPPSSPTGPIPGRIVFTSDRDGNNEIYLMNADGTLQTRLTNNPADDVDPAWTHDGSKIVFASDRDGNFEIYMMNLRGRGLTRLTDNPADDRYPSWQPGRIFFTSDRDGNREIYVMNADGSGQTNLTNNPADDVDPDCCSVDWEVLFTSDRDGNNEIYLMNLDGSGLTRLTDNPADDRCPAAGADPTESGGWREEVTFTSDRDGNSEIYVMNADGSGLTRLTNNPADDDNPDRLAGFWGTPNSIVFDSDRDGNREIYMMNDDGSGLTRLTNNPADDFDPAAWAP